VPGDARDRFDQHPNTLQFLSYGNPLFAELLDSVVESENLGTNILRFEDDGDPPVIAWYDVSTPQPKPIKKLSGLRRALGDDTEPAAGASARADDDFQQQVNSLRERIQARTAQFIEHRQKTLRVQAQRLLIKAALVEIALGQQRDLFTEEPYPSSFGEEAIKGLRRHKSPWSWMLYIANEPDLQAKEDDPYFHKIRNLPQEKLQEEFKALTSKAKALLKNWKAIEAQSSGE
jgi:hypothetical protein